MKKIFFFLVAVISFVACADSGPTAAEELHLKSFVFRSSIDYEWCKSLKDEFIGEIYLGNIQIEGLDIPHTEEDQPRSFGEAVLILFEDYHSTLDLDGREKDLKERWLQRLQWDLEYGRLWSESKIAKSIKVCQKDSKQATMLYNRLISSFLQYVQGEADKQVKIISWEYDFMNTGDSYTAYEVVYQVGTGFYVLVSLVEFDDNDRYEYKILNKANSLTEINDYF